jgi:hypothetical protein
MNAYRSLIVMVLALAVPALAAAQDAAPTPDPHEYDDPAMHYTAPAAAHLVGQMQHPTLQTLSQDPTPVATWVLGTTQYNAKAITITMELYSGSLDGFDSSYENALRADDPATLVKNKQHVLLQNGMPALFVEVTQGAGFQTRKIFAYLWIDSQRAVVLSVVSTLGGIDEDTAKALLAGATAVQYPTGGQP